MSCKALGSCGPDLTLCSYPGAEGAALVPQHQGKRAVGSSNPDCAGKNSLLSRCLSLPPSRPIPP